MYDLVIFNFIQLHPVIFSTCGKRERRQTNSDLERLDSLRVEGTCGETEIREFHMATRVDKKVLSGVDCSVNQL
jgi:hypothetical protein